MKCEYFPEEGQIMKKGMKKAGIIAALFLLSIVLGFLGVYFLEKNEESYFGLISILGCTFLFGGLVLYCIVSVVKKISGRAFQKKDEGHQELKEVHYHEINSNGKAVRQTQYTYNKAVVEDRLNWPLMIVSLALFPPLGISWLIIKIISEKQSYYKNGTRLTVVGGVYFVFFLLSTSLPIMEHALSGKFDNAVISFSLISFVLFVFSMSLLISGLAIRRLGFLNDKLMYLITVDAITGIDELSKQMNKQNAKIVEMVLSLIKAGILEHAYYDPRDNEIIVSGISKKVACQCDSCAGTTVFYSNDKNRKCIFCGAEL